MKNLNDTFEGNSHPPEIFSIWPKFKEYTGLSEYESKIYLCLLSMGSGTAKKLSLFGEVPRTKVYVTLKNLIEKGLVVEMSGRPAQFVPSSPSVFVPLMQSFMTKIKDLKFIMKILNDAHEKGKGQVQESQKSVWYINNFDDIVLKCLDLLKRSREEIVILTNGDGLSILFNLAHSILDNIKENGIEVRFYSPLDPSKDFLARELSYFFVVKKIDYIGNILFIEMDHKEYLLANIENKSKTFVEAIYSNDPILTDMLHKVLIVEQIIKKEFPYKLSNKLNKR